MINVCILYHRSESDNIVEAMKSLRCPELVWSYVGVGYVYPVLVGDRTDLESNVSKYIEQRGEVTCIDGRLLDGMQCVGEEVAYAM